MKDAISTPGMGAMGAGGIVRALGGNFTPGRGSGNKKARAKLKKQSCSNKKKASKSK